MNSRRVSNLLCYIILGLVALSLVVKYLLTNVISGISTDIIYWIDQSAYILTALATLISAFSYAQSRRNGLIMVLLIIFVAVIIVFKFVL